VARAATTSLATATPVQLVVVLRVALVLAEAQGAPAAAIAPAAGGAQVARVVHAAQAAADIHGNGCLQHPFALYIDIDPLALIHKAHQAIYFALNT
jgi:ABC-type uncharacterized transport system permease subunit